jgi:hypothetical protein
VASGGFEPSNAEQSDLQTDTNGAIAHVFTGVSKVSGQLVPDTCQIHIEGGVILGTVSPRFRYPRTGALLVTREASGIRCHSSNMASRWHTEPN